jgi:hypothetical protein
MLGRRVMICKLDGFKCAVVQDHLMEQHIRDKHPESKDFVEFYRKHLTFQEEEFWAVGKPIGYEAEPGECLIGSDEEDVVFE